MPDDREGGGANDGSDREDAQVRPFWSGIITFGLVSVPVNLFAAYRSGRPSLRMVDEDGTPLERHYYCPSHEKKLDRDEIVRGYEVDEGRFVVVRDEELDGLEPEKSREIDLRRFVKRSELDPVFFQRAYFLTPSTEATKPYRLLARVMEEGGRAGIARFVMRGREYLVAILADEGILRAEAMRFHDEIRSVEDVGLPEAVEPDDDDVDAIRDVIEERSAEELDPEELRNRWAERLLDMAAEKRDQDEDVVEPPEGEETDPEEERVVDIMDVLRQNLRGGSNGDGTPSGGALGEKTKKELYEQARELDISGRSKMTKDDLVDAIREAS